jgi:predicted RNA-binding protein
MCLSKAYLEKGSKKELIMSDIASVKVEGSKLVLKSLFGEKKEVAATIREIDFTASLLKLEVSREGVPVD